MSNANWVEVAWTAGAIIGATLLLPMVIDSWRYLRYLQRSGMNGALLISARSRLRDERKDLIEMTIFSVLGIASVIEPSPSGSTNDPTYLSYLLLIGFFLVLTQVLIRGRQRQSEYLRMGHQEHPQARRARILEAESDVEP